MKASKLVTILYLISLPINLLLIFTFGLLYLLGIRIDAFLIVILVLSMLLVIPTGLVVLINVISILKAIIKNQAERAYLKGVKDHVDMKLEGNSSLILTRNNKYRPLVSSLNSLLSENYEFKQNYLYQHEDFVKLVSRVLHNSNSGVLVRFLDVNMKDEDIPEYMNALPEAYFGRGQYGFDMFIANYTTKEYIGEVVRKFATGKPIRVVTTYYPETAIDNMFASTYPYYQTREQFNVVESENFDIDGILSLMYRFEDKDNPLDALSRLLYQYVTLSPYTHIITLVDGKVLKGARQNGYRYYEDYQKEDFTHFEDIDLMLSNNHDVHILFLSVDPLHKSLSKEDLQKRNLIIHAIKKLILYHLGNLDHEENIHIKDEILQLTSSYYYRVDNDMNIVEASDNLVSKFGEPIIGKNSFNVLFAEKKYKDLKLNANKRDRVIVPALGTDVYDRIVKEHNAHLDVYLIKAKKEAVSDYKLFKDRLLSALEFNRRGYLLCFKIDSLNQIAKKYKVGVEDIINTIYPVLSNYSLLANLYRKSEDEFVYLLEGSGREGAYFLAEKLANAFNEKFEIEEDKGIPLTTKVIALSFPLEVSTIFEFESLCRSLYRQADKKGKLYRFEEEPRYIDRNHELVELLDSSFQNSNIPLELKPIKNKIGYTVYEDVSLNFVNSKGEKVRSDDMTLIAKKAHFYSSLIERSIKQLDFASGKIYVIPMSIEGINEETFDAIDTMLDVKRASKKHVIFEVREKDVKNTREVFNKLLERGFKFALSSLDTYVKNTNVNEYEYVRVEKRRYNKDILYTLKLTNLLNQGLKSIVAEEDKELLATDLVE